MGRWLEGIVTALIVLAATSALGAWLKGPIDDWVSRDRLQAEVQLAPWYARPIPAAKTKDEPPASDDALADALARLRIDSTDSSDFGVARVTISNESTNTVSSINFRLSSPLSADEAVIVESDGKTRNLHNVNRIVLADMKPGDRAIVYLWGRYSTYLFPEGFRSYSSAGRFRARFDWPTARDRAFESGIGRFLNDYADIATWVFVASLTIMFGLLGAFYNSYYKLLLKDEGHYHNERNRFLSAPDKFEPQLKASASPAAAGSTPPPAAPGATEASE